MKIGKIILGLLFTSIIGGIFASVLDVNSLYTVLPLIAMSVVIPMPVGVFGMAFQKEVWVADIREQLFSGVFAFIRNSVNHDAFVDNKTVHVPQGGVAATIEKNLSLLPAVVSQRDDTDLTYDITNYKILPKLITNLEALQASYNKRNSIMLQNIAAVSNRLANETLVAWAAATAGNIIETTGAATSLIAPPSGTSTRLGLLLADIATAAAKLDEQDVPSTGRFLVIPAKMYWNFVTIEKASLLSIDYSKGLSDQDMAMGIVAKIYGFNIIIRSSAAVYATGGTTPKAVGASGATTDRFGAVGWQQDCVSNALGAVKAYFEADSPIFYGDIISAEVNHGAAKIRTDGYGIVTIVQPS